MKTSGYADDDAANRIHTKNNMFPAQWWRDIIILKFGHAPKRRCHLRIFYYSSDGHFV